MNEVNKSEKMHDVIIIGAGSAGLSARSEVEKNTDNYLIVDGGTLGTTCARVGCMPSKVLIEAANIYFQKQKFDKIGVSGQENLKISSVKLMEHVRELRDFFVQSTVKDMDQWGDKHFLEGYAEFQDKQTILVNGTSYKAKKFIIATGSAPVIPANFEDYKEDLLTTDKFFELKSLPKKMAVIGAGAIGLELAQALARVGVEVLLFDPKPSFGGLANEDIKKQVLEKLETELTVIQAGVESLQKNANGFTLHSEGKKFEVEQVLMAVGRKPRLKGLKLDKAGIVADEKGKVEFHPETCRIPGTNCYLAGDANAHLPVLHEASDDGRISGYNSVREKDHSFKRRVRMTICFSSPNIAVIGKSLADLKKDQADFVTGEVDFKRQGRSRTKLENHGLLKVYAEKQKGEILGAELYAPDGEHLAHFLAAAIDTKATVFTMLSQPFYHPVVEEGLRTALRDLSKKVTEQCKDFDLVPCQNPPAGA